MALGDCRALVFTSAPAGAQEQPYYEQFVDRLIARVEAVPVPTVAVVEGYAVGGGLAIAAACDLRICTPDAKFGLPIARTVANCLSMRNYARLVALLGASRALAMILMADIVRRGKGAPGRLRDGSGPA